MASSFPGGAGLADVNHGPELQIAVGIVTAMAFISVVLRLWVREVMIKSIGWDDRFMVAAMMLSAVALFLTIADVHYGAGRHAVYLTDPVKRTYGLYLNFISQPFYLVGVVFVKVSVGLFLLRLTPSLFYHRFIWGMQAFMGIYTIIALITILTQCRPLKVLWDSSVTNAVCFSPLGLRACAYFNAACSIFADLVFALLPIPMLWNVKINMRVKIALFCILGLGLFATAACIAKVYYLSFYGKHDDFLWDSTNITIWTACELNIGIFAASIATLKPLFRATFQSSSQNEYNSSREHKSMDKHGFVKHISNARGVSQIGDGSGSTSTKDDGFEMFGSMATASRKESMGSETNILPLQNSAGRIMKTTKVDILVDNMTEKFRGDSNV